MIENISDCTNRYITKIQPNFSRERNATKTDPTEIKALIGLLFLGGVLRSSHLNCKDLFSTDGTGVERFPATMSMYRFLFLLRCLRFDNIETRDDRKLLDNLAPIRDLFEAFVSNCKTNYCISEYATIDEKLESFRGKCKFRQYLPSKPAKYGIKIFALADAKTFYTLNLEIYAGKQPEGPYKVDNSPSAVVKRLVEPISGTGRNVTCDNWFTSVPLAKHLLDSNRLTLVGTIRKNKREIPPSFVQHRSRAQYSSKFAFDDQMTLVSYVPKKGKTVLLLSTMHYDAAIDSETGVKKKPEINTFYNSTKSGVDVVDALCATYNVGRVSNRWPLTIFYALLNVAGINSLVIYQSNKSERVIRREFLKRLSEEMVLDHMKRRLTMENLPRSLRSRISGYVGEETPMPGPPPKKSRTRCGYCPSSADRKTKTECHICATMICREHTTPTCYQCAEKASGSRD
ncbi:piggyBac transposable element-derived protein 4-like [Periplaneta americana]|uniref:piggyBac transposable element-derived protein 4-like n=1 Tax=Periplaneta americana TaxID=6978 RepID=UPI0037E92CE6